MYTTTSVTLLPGVFSWITINYLLGHFSPESHAHQTTEDGQTDEYIHTVGVMDMGGASLQIAFEVPQQVTLFFIPSSSYPFRSLNLCILDRSFNYL